MPQAEFFGCYDFNDEWYLVEMVLNEAPSKIDWAGIVVPEEGVDNSCWQCPYMEQYLNADGTKKLCETYDLPADDARPCRVVFFLFKGGKDAVLHTPYGDFALNTGAKVPARLEGIVEFEEAD